MKLLEIPEKSGEMIGIMKKISQCNFTKINHEFCVLKLRTKKAKIAEIAKIIVLFLLLSRLILMTWRVKRLKIAPLSSPITVHRYLQVQTTRSCYVLDEYIGSCT